MADLVSNPRHQAIARTIVGFAGDLGLQLIAEGVETEQQRQLLLGMGCRLAQGYLFGRPMDSDAFGEWLATESERKIRRA